MKCGLKGCKHEAVEEMTILYKTDKNGFKLW